jgi:hypothetical protein
MSRRMKPLLLVAVAGLCFAAAESRVSRANILTVEAAINEKFAARTPDPYDLLGNARGTYLEGYGALFTVELDLVNAGPLTLSPFKQSISAEEVASLRDRKMKKLPILKDSMRTLLLNASVTLDGLPLNERVAMEAILFNYTWESSRSLPHRVFMSAEKEKLLEAKTNHASQAELAALIEEQER